MTTHTNVSGSWKDVDEIHTKVSGSWVGADKVYSKVAGNWEGVFSSAPPTLPTPTLATSTTTANGGLTARINNTNPQVGATTKWQLLFTAPNSSHDYFLAYTTLWSSPASQSTATSPITTSPNAIYSHPLYYVHVHSTWYSTAYGTYRGFTFGGGCANGTAGTFLAHCHYRKAGWTDSAESATASRTYTKGTTSCASCCCCG